MWEVPKNQKQNEKKKKKVHNWWLNYTKKNCDKWFENIRSWLYSPNDIFPKDKTEFTSNLSVIISFVVVVLLVWNYHVSRIKQINGNIMNHDC